MLDRRDPKAVLFELILRTLAINSLNLRIREAVLNSKMCLKCKLSQQLSLYLDSHLVMHKMKKDILDVLN